MSKKRLGNRRRKRGIWFSLFGSSPLAPCHWCKKLLSFNQATVDHEPALAEGGKLKQAVIACYDCNQERGKETQLRINQRRKESVSNVC